MMPKINLKVLFLQKVKLCVEREICTEDVECNLMDDSICNTHVSVGGTV